jgi:hypothetical protein
MSLALRERKFGVEIECGLPGGPNEAIRLLHKTPSVAHWASEGIHSDGSGVEIPSPILQGRKGLAELRTVMQLLVDNGGYVSTEDGLHVHHDAPEFLNDRSAVERLVETWAVNQDVIDNLVHSVRRGTQGYGHWACEKTWNETTVAQFKRGPEPSYYGHTSEYYPGGRGALNITALNEHGTVEFRQHEGTLDFNVAAAWIRFGQAFMENALRRKSILTCTTPEDLLRRIRASKGAALTLLSKSTVGAIPTPNPITSSRTSTYSVDYCGDCDFPVDDCDCEGQW